MKIFIIAKKDFKEYANNISNYIKNNFKQDIDFIIKDNDLDYVKEIVNVSKQIISNVKGDRLITIDESGGLGFCAAAKVKKMIVAQCADEHSAHMTREHNNAIGISLGANITNIFIAKEIIKLFFETKFAAGRHMIRIDMLNKLG
ncbi:MAG: galactose-6-phosphate isomerase subunit LacA [Candidatus Hepatoplasma scabrum]|nr:MAG: galactose-6-phosphate isomerase subunit LacA [Candidatus Hepatoplasma sp.]